MPTIDTYVKTFEKLRRADIWEIKIHPDDFGDLRRAVWPSMHEDFKLDPGQKSFGGVHLVEDESAPKITHSGSTG